jgi:hypothetical protein
VAQDRTWEVASHATLDAAHVVLDVPASPDGAPTRVTLHGTLDTSIDGSELDPVATWRGGIADRASASPLALSPGAEIVDADEAAHRYMIEAPPGVPIHASLAIAPMAAAHLVTATELRQSLRGAIEVDVMRRSAPPPLAVAALAEEEPRGLAAGLLAAVLAAVGFVVLRRREPEEARLIRRARRAREAIAARARALGPALAGLTVSAEKLEHAIRRGRDHVRAIDAALRATRWAEGEVARARAAELARRRDAVRRDLEHMTSELEATVVRLATLATERHADVEAEAVSARLRAEIALAEDVEREVAAL